MCILCTLQFPLKVGWILTLFQFSIWVISMGIYTCSWGLYGKYVEQYTRWAVCTLVGLCILLYFIMIGAQLGAFHYLDWSDIVIANLKKLFLSDYEAIERNTPKLSIDYWALPSLVEPEVESGIELEKSNVKRSGGKST